MTFTYDCNINKPKMLFIPLKDSAFLFVKYHSSLNCSFIRIKKMSFGYRMFPKNFCHAKFPEMHGKINRFGCYANCDLAAFFWQGFFFIDFTRLYSNS